MAMTLGFADERDKAAISDLLLAARLPSDDIKPQDLRYFLVMREGKDIIGTAGVQPIGKSAGLLRSLAVQEEYRGKGVASKLYRAAEDHAAAMGFRELFAITESVEKWLARLGYERLTREQAPEHLRATAQFAALCPATAAIMRKKLPIYS